MTQFGPPAIHGQGDIIKKSSHESACQIIIYLNADLILALVAIQKCFVLLHDDLGQNTMTIHTHIP